MPSLYTLRPGMEAYEDQRIRRQVDVHLVAFSEVAAFPITQKLLGAVLITTPTPGLPHIEDSALILERVSAELVQGSGIQVTAEYVGRPLVVMDWTGGLRSDETNRDKDGVAITTAESPGGQSQGHLLPRQVPEPVARVVIRCSGTTPAPFNNPITAAKAVIGRTNQDLPPPTFPSGGGIGDWLCTAVRCRYPTPIGSAPFELTLEFSRRPSPGWKARLVHLAEDGEPIAAPVVGVSQVDVQVYKEAIYQDIPGL